MKTLRRALLMSCLLASFGALAQVAPYPSKPVRIVMPYPPGGSGDFLARLVATRLSTVFGQQFVVDNKGGASGNIGAEYVARAAPDGYTILCGSDIQFTINPLLSRKLPFNPDTEFEPITHAAYIELAFVVPAALGVNSISEFVARAKANPGNLSYASTGEGSSHHLAMEMFSQRAGIKMVHVPYKGSGQALPDVLANNVQAMFTGVSQALPHMQSGRLKGLAVGAASRIQAAPGIPTLADSLPGFEARNWWAFYAPKGTPRDIVDKLNAEIVKIVKSPDVKEQLVKAGFEVYGSTPAELVQRTAADRTMWREVIKQANVRVE